MRYGVMVYDPNHSRIDTWVAFIFTESLDTDNEGHRDAKEYGTQN
jgi:hypothetical protein